MARSISALTARSSRAFIAVATLVLTTVGVTGVNLIAQPAAAAGTNDVSIHVVDAKTGSPITTFQYLVNADNTGTTEQRSPSDGCSPEVQGYPDTCHWTSVGTPSSSPVVISGDESDFAGVNTIHLPTGRYLVSVLADGHKLDGAHFATPLDNGVVTVEMQPTPIPDGTLQTAVFEDSASTNGAPDLPAEHGLANFRGQINDTLGQVTTDVSGAPLCGTGVCLSKCYVVGGGVDQGTVAADPQNRCPVDAGGLTVTRANGSTYTGAAGDVVEGKLEIPNIGSNRYTLTVTPPDGTDWVQTTTLEGNHDYDSWIMEGATGLDTEFVVSGEPFPAVIFGYVKPNAPANGLGGGGTIKGVVDAVKVYVPATGGIVSPDGGITGGRIDKPIDRPWVSLSDLNNGDQTIWVGRGATDGTFTIPHVPNGSYSLTYWDEDQNYILAIQNVTVANNETVDTGVLGLAGWWTEYTGYVFNDTNRNGVMDWTDTNHNGCPDAGEGEQGVPNYTLTMRKRDNSLMDRGSNAAGTDACGRYIFEAAYPMTQWLVMEAYNDLYYTTGVTYQADNQPTPTTVLGAGVDVSTLPIIGLSGTLDWGVHPYDAGGTNGLDPQNGGIVGTVSYDTTRNELDPRYAAVEDWQPGISGIPVDLYAPAECQLDPDTGEVLPDQVCDAAEQYQLDSDGSVKKGDLLNTYVTETWQQPGADHNANGDGECIPRGVDNQALAYPAVQQVTNSPTDCLEGPLMGVQFQKGYSTVDGNYGFAEGCFAPNVLDASDPENPTCSGPDGFQPLPGATDYLVHVDMPDDQVRDPADAQPLYKVTREEDINIGNGDEIVPQTPPPACAGALHTVDVAGDPTGNDNYPEIVGDDNNGIPAGVTVPASTPTVNATFLDIDGSPYEGTARPLCDTKLVPLANGRSIVPTFNYFTDVPLPGRLWGLLVDDLNFSSNPKSLAYGEKAGVAFAPVGIYDYTNRLVETVESDYNGLFDVLMPSTNRINCPTPSGVCTNLYRFVGNDPGVPGRLNLNYKPGYRTIAAEFEAMPGVINPADLAPTTVGVVVQLPGGQIAQVECKAPPTTPQLFTVNKPYIVGSGTFHIEGANFDTGVSVLLDDVALAVSNATTTSMDATLSAGTGAGQVPFGPHQLTIVDGSGQRSVNALTFHVLDPLVPNPFPSGGVLSNFSNNNNGFGGGNWTLDNAGAFSTSGGVGHIRTGGNTRNGLRVGDFGTDQDARFLLSQRSASATQQGLLLKASGGTPNATTAQWIEVAVVNATGTINVLTKAANAAPVLQATPTMGSFTTAGSQQLGARALSDGTIIVYKGTAELGRVTVPATGSWMGRIGVRFAGTGTSNAAEARIDDFGGGNVTFAAGVYHPNVYEVGPGMPFAPANTLPDTADHAIQRALDAAAASPGNDLVVVYPGVATADNPRMNPRGAYYENLIVNAPVKLQGVGPGGFQGNTFVPGSIIDGGAFGGDSPVATDWYTTLGGITWDGNQDVYDGAVITLFAHATGTTAFGSSYKAAIDGFDLRGGDQLGFPNNINEIGGTPTGQPGGLVTQGGAIFANAYARNLQITNNTVQNNGGAYGTIRLGTADLPAPNASSHNENVRIANNRIINNAGTNLAGAIGLFAGADHYDISGNDLCGNFSAEYGGAISVLGRSGEPSTTDNNIHGNRIYLNQSYDEGGGIMIAGALPANPNVASPGSGPVNIYDNVIQQNLSNDDGGGIRFLMAGNFPMNVYNNMVVNNVSTHEGGGVALDDAPNVRFFNNTVMKNVTTATAVTSDGTPAPAGLSTALNSAPLQAALPGHPAFSPPTLFNNIFWDNRAGSQSLGVVTGLGQTGDAAPIDGWDIGSVEATGPLTPTNSVIQTAAGAHGGYTDDASNRHTDPNVVGPFDTGLTFQPWRTNPAFIGAVMVTVDAAPSLLGDYHIQPGSPAVNLGAANKAGVNAPTRDIDHEVRRGLPDAGADELPPLPDVSITKTDNRSVTAVGAVNTYTITVDKTTDGVIAGIVVNDPVPANLTGVTWTCATTGAGSSCATPSGSGGIANRLVTLGAAVDSTATFTLRGTVGGSPGGTVANTATVTPPASYPDTDAADNTSTDSDRILNPNLDVIDNFNRPNSTAGLGSNWAQTGSAIRIQSNGAQCGSGFLNLPCLLGGSATWNTPYGTIQGAGYTFASTSGNNASLVLKGSGGVSGIPGSFIRVQSQGSNVQVGWTVLAGVEIGMASNHVDIPGTFGNGTTMVAIADEVGNVYVFRNGTLLGVATVPSSWAQPAGNSLIGLQLPYNVTNAARVDDFRGGNA